MSASRFRRDSFSGSSVIQVPENQHWRRSLVDSGLGYIDVSTKGKNRREWCEITGYDGSEAQLQAIRNLASLPIDFTWSMVITPENVQSLCESVQIAHDNGEAILVHIYYR